MTGAEGPEIIICYIVQFILLIDAFANKTMFTICGKEMFRVSLWSVRNKLTTLN